MSIEHATDANDNDNRTIHGTNVTEWIASHPQLRDLIDLKPTAWFNDRLAPTAAALPDVGLTVADVDDAAARLKRFAPLIAELFPETKPTAGTIESPLAAVPDMQRALGERHDQQLPGQLWVKLDSELPVSGSIKARGGIYEVLKHAEDLAVEAGLLPRNANVEAHSTTHTDAHSEATRNTSSTATSAVSDLAPHPPTDRTDTDADYRTLASPEARALFAKHTIAVGSTGNLGLSIGIMAAALGFNATVHMSADARQWKKDKLRSHGVNVVEYESDYSVAVAAGREQAKNDPSVYFVDDENSSTLFLGYAVAARRLAGQLQTFDIPVDQDHPLFVYLPCGVGGGPGGVSFGLKTVFGDAVHCIFVEPTHSPCMFLGEYTGLFSDASVQDFGIDNRTAADGLAVGRASGFVARRMARLLDGFVTVDDDDLFRSVALLDRTSGHDIEPSSAAGFAGPWRVLADRDYRERLHLTDERMAHATHVAWITGGSMVPRDDMAGYIARGESLLQ
ncbi:D-serine ammonia-lyase [Bifidobacterium biavatii]|uniref:Probable D-serine dehydratase n=1 Tax=Bifidobacterium biavatii DSM 23969 TaxID=1437608 RepID=A0A087A151_9BIFI|nr:D-serine ammonia-lyase [Bifidobacterium biavatii]KFI52501.1 D-serine ammonia-lyase [Bifidobacterium biavatii DSM 23969]